MLSLLVPLALAGDDATRCFADWTGPTEGCALRGTWHLEATASTEKGARKALRNHIADTVVVAQAADRARAPTLEAAHFVLCDEALAKAFVNCFPEPVLDQELLCFVELKDRECWSGDVLTVEDVGWRAQALGRRDMCAAVDAYLVAQAYQDVATRRAICKAKCTTETKVRCPSPDGAVTRSR